MGREGQQIGKVMKVKRAMRRRGSTPSETLPAKTLARRRDRNLLLPAKTLARERERNLILTANTLAKEARLELILPAKTLARECGQNFSSLQRHLHGSATGTYYSGPRGKGERTRKT